MKAGVVHDPYWEERGRRARESGDMEHISAGQTGYATTLEMTDDQVEAAKERKTHPFGFQAPKQPPRAGLSRFRRP